MSHKHYKIANIIGRNLNMESAYRHVEKVLTLKYNAITLAPVVYDDDLCEETVTKLNEMCEQRIEMCDLCVVVPMESADGYIVDDYTVDHIIKAAELKKPVYIWAPSDTMKLLNIKKLIDEEKNKRKESNDCEATQ